MLGRTNATAVRARRFKSPENIAQIGWPLACRLVHMASVSTAHRIPANSSTDVRPRAPIARTLRDGLVAGQTAGIVMAVALMAVYTFVFGQSPFVPLQTIGAYARGASALDGIDPVAIAAGVALHQLGFALAWGLLFGIFVAVIRPERALSLMFLGLAVGLLAQVVDVYVVLPQLATALHVPNYWAEHVHPAASWFVHVVFGLSLSLYPWKFDPAAHRYA